MLHPEEVMKLMKKYGIPIPKQRVVKTHTEALKFSDKIGYPVVLKLYSPKISHKTDVGGVFTDVRKEDLEKKFRKIMKIKGCEAVLVQKQVRGIENIIGGIDDPQFGSCISFGTGGIFVEVLKDINFRVCPISRRDAKEMIEETKVYDILKGYRGKKYDIKGITDTLMKVSKLMVREKIKELDINPLICSEEGVWAVDVRVN
ncbi:MAG: acetate--CoA ligase family protein [Candidatus Aenigmarchaeota archaeon]|nr:acetate--CoA ligase family protein [Candidatus Aenigmarchaeota archaeon]